MSAGVLMWMCAGKHRDHRGSWGGRVVGWPGMLGHVGTTRMTSIARLH